MTFSPNGRFCSVNDKLWSIDKRRKKEILIEDAWKHELVTNYGTLVDKYGNEHDRKHALIRTYGGRQCYAMDFSPSATYVALLISSGSEDDKLWELYVYETENATLVARGPPISRSSFRCGFLDDTAIWFHDERLRIFGWEFLRANIYPMFQRNIFLYSRDLSCSFDFVADERGKTVYVHDRNGKTVIEIPYYRLCDIYGRYLVIYQIGDNICIVDLECAGKGEWRLTRVCNIGEKVQVFCWDLSMGNLSI